MRENHIRILCSVLKVDLVYEAPDGSLTAFFDSTPDSPLMRSQKLRQLMREGILGQSGPFLRSNQFNCYFAGLRADDGFLYMGPMSHTRLSQSKLRQLAKAYGIGSEALRALPIPAWKTKNCCSSIGSSAGMNGRISGNRRILS